jgi:alpha-beta hydrolase superfamily lysophospholipase
MHKNVAAEPGPWRRQQFPMDDGTLLAADIGGPEDTATVLLAHGGGQTRHSWSGAMTALVNKGYRVVNFDARGHGESEWSPQGDYSFERRRDD